MSSESERRLSTEELKRLNQPQSMQAPPTPPDTPTRQDWNDLLVALTALYRLERSNSDRLDHLEASVGAQEALLRAMSQLVGQLPHPGPAGGPGAGCGPNSCHAETGCEKERASLFSAQIAPALHPLEQTVLGSGSSIDDWSCAVGGVVQLGKDLEHIQSDLPVRDATTMHQHTDRKLRQKERQKKIALGHKADDHEDEIDLTMKGF